MTGVKVVFAFATEVIWVTRVTLSDVSLAAARHDACMCEEPVNHWASVPAIAAHASLLIASRDVCCGEHRPESPTALDAQLVVQRADDRLRPTRAALPLVPDLG